MKAKGLILFFSVTLILICIWQLSFNFVTNKVENRADVSTTNRVLGGQELESFPKESQDSLYLVYQKARQDYLDSISNKDVYNLLGIKYTYQKCKDQQLNLGLDLQGGMNVVMQVGIEDLVKALADNSTDANFKKALDLTKQKELTNPQSDYVDLFKQSWDETAPTGKLASIFATLSNKDKVNYNSTNDEVIKFIKDEESGAFDRTFNIIRSRIDKFGVAEPNITSQPGAGRIIIELPGVENPARVRKLLQASAILEFWETYDNVGFYNYLDAANTAIKNRMVKPSDSAKAPADSSNLLTATDNTAKKDSSSLLASNDSSNAAKDTSGLAGSDTSNQQQSFEDFKKDNPLLGMLIPNVQRDDKGQVNSAPEIGTAEGKDTAAVDRMLALDYVKAVLPRDAKLLWGAKPIDEAGTRYALFAIKKQIGSDKAPLEGDKVTSARRDVNQFGQNEIAMSMNNEGAQIWKIMTGKNVGKFIAIVLDDYVYSAPIVKGEIPSGNSTIEGSFTIEEASDLANILQAGKLPAPARIIAEDVVGPSLGKESIKAGLQSVIIALIAILAFMIIYYNTSGIIAVIALVFNLFFIIGVLASRGATLTLPGIAGIVLTMGMAVDANVLIHERIKEELKRGKNLAKAISDGHTKSYSAVFDTHLTTLITALILAYFGLGPVLGYAVTLSWGVILTLFTAVFMAHVIFEWWQKSGRTIKFSTPVSNFDLTKYNIQFVAKRKYAYIISGTLAIIGLISIFTKGFDYGVDFSGGRSYIVQFEQPVTSEEVKADLTPFFNNEAPEVKTYGANNKLKITTGYLVNETNSSSDSTVDVALYNGLKKHIGDNVDFNTFTKKYQLSSQVVGPTISADILQSAYKAIIFSLIGIFLYILLRFRKWQFALGAIVALIHDVLMVMGAYSLLSGIVPFTLEVDESFVAAALTVMGYSVADTVIVFDRIREFLREHPNMDMKKVINDAINNTLNRTIITSSTVLLVLLILFIFGGDAIRGFSFAILLGVTFGTYSSIFVATPIVVDFMTKRKKADEATSTSPRKPVAVK